VPTDRPVPSIAVQRFALATFVAGVVALGAALPRTDPAVVTDPGTWALAALIVAGEFLPVTVRRRGAVVHYMISSAFAFALLLYAGAAPAMLALVTASLTSDLRARCSWERIAFNVGQYAVALAAGALVLGLAGHAPGALRAADLTLAALWPVLPAALAVFLTNHLVVGAIVALHQRSALRPVLLEDLLFQTATSGVLLAIAPVVVVVAARSLWLLPCLLVPVLALHRSTKQTVSDAERAHHDAVTGLPNRLRFQQILRWEIDEQRTSRPGVLLAVDVGSIGEVNDTLGQRAGDRLLRLIGERLVAVAGPDATVARIGGDEFGVLLPGPDEEQAALERAERVHAELGRPFVLDGFDVHPRPRIGVALSGTEGQSSEALLRRADVAVHLAKRRGAGIQLYASEHDREAQRRLALVSDLRAAIADGSVDVHLQPKAELRSNRIVGLEALARWEHPVLGRVAPDEFIPLAERSGLVDPLTTLVLDRALAHRSRLAAEGFPLGVAVNLSLHSLHDAGLPDRVAGLLERWGVPAEALHLEMTESTMLGGVDGPHGVLDALRALGVRLAVDDFGTGYSSLARLKHLPVDQLKIDRSFVRDLAHDATDAAIIRSALDLARTLGLTVVAEGVESAAAWVALRDMGCDEVQGHLVSRALPVDDLLAWLRQRAGAVPAPVPALVGEAAARVVGVGAVVTPIARGRR
jgi:diguanylate cyclase (GGDEF)-like protein